MNYWKFWKRDYAILRIIVETSSPLKSTAQISNFTSLLLLFRLMCESCVFKMYEIHLILNIDMSILNAMCFNWALSMSRYFKLNKWKINIFSWNKCNSFDFIKNNNIGFICAS